MAARSRLVRVRSRRLWRAYHHFGLHELVVVVVSFLIYFAIRGAVVGRFDEALANAGALIDFQARFGLNQELEMQSWVVGHVALVRALNWVYFWGHMPLVIVVAVWLFLRHRRAYGLARNAFLASGAIAVVMYALWPVAPPRLLPGSEFIDTMAIYDRYGYNAQETSAFVNPYAALPSLHFGWSLLLGVILAWVGRNPAWVAFGILWPVAMFFAVVMTGNHYIIDAILGGAVSFAGLGIAVLIERYRGSAWSAVRSRLRGALVPAPPPRGRPVGPPGAPGEPPSRTRAERSSTD